MRRGPWDFILPGSFDACEYLPPWLHRYADESRYLLNVTLRKHISRDVDAHGYARLNGTLLRKVIDNRRFTEHVQALRGVIAQDRIYRPGEFSMGYRLESRFLKDKPVRYQPTNKRILAKLEKVQSVVEGIQRSRRKPIHNQLDRLQRECLGINYPLANAIVDSLWDEDEICQRVLIENLHLGEPTYSVSRYGRMFNGLTGLAKELRCTVTIAGEPMSSLDLICCQPALLALLIEVSAQKCTTYKHTSAASLETLLADLPPSLPMPDADFAVFRDLVCAGGFYECLCEATGRDRDYVKKRFLVDVLARYGTYPVTDVEEHFARLFPSVFAFIKAVNRSCYCKLIRLLQRCESWLVLELVAPRLIPDTPIVSVHNSIFSRAGDIHLVRDAFKSVFAELGFSIGLKEEWWGPSPALIIGTTSGSEPSGPPALAA